MIPEFGTRLVGIDYMDRPGVHAVIEDDDGQVGVIETSTGYFLPGGGMDPGETEVDALKREIMEEIGYQVSALAEIGAAVEYIQAAQEKKHYRIQSKFYQVRLDSRIAEGIEKDHRFVWLPKEEAQQLLTRQSQAWAVRNGAKR